MTIEVTPIDDLFCEELAYIEPLGPNRRLVFAVRVHNERVVVVKLIVPTERLARIARQLTVSPTDCMADGEEESEPRRLAS